MQPLRLEEEETQIFNGLLTLSNEAFSDSEFQLLVSGGWVRDKSMGIPSNDIDILFYSPSAPNLQQIEEKFKAAKSNSLLDGIKIFPANPTKGKLNDVLMLKLYQTTLDCVTLKSSNNNFSASFSERLRVDASLRDLTINAMYYDIKSNKILDPTGKGISDIQNKILRCPIAPIQTFEGDPIRILRIIRFSTKFKDFAIDPPILEAMRTPAVQNLLDILSRERIEIEFTKLINGPRPEHALRQLADYSFLSHLFPANKTESVWCAEKTRQATEGTEFLIRFFPFEQFSVCTKKSIMLSGLLLPFSFQGDFPFTKFQFRELRYESKVVDDAFLFLQYYNEMALLSFHPTSQNTVKIGRLLITLKESWPFVWTLAHISAPIQEGTPIPSVSAAKDQFSAFSRTLESLGLLNPPVWELKPLIKPLELATLLNVSKGEIATALKLQTDWQIAHPNGTKEACAVYMKAQHEQKQRETKILAD